MPKHTNGTSPYRLPVKNGRKLCGDCGLWKSLRQFGWHAYNNTWRADCKACARDRANAWYDDNRFYKRLYSSFYAEWRKGGFV